MGGELQGLGHYGDKIRLRNGLAHCDSQWGVAVGAFSQIRDQEAMSLNRIHRRKNRLILNAPGGKLIHARPPLDMPIPAVA